MLQKRLTQSFKLKSLGGSVQFRRDADGPASDFVVDDRFDFRFRLLIVLHRQVFSQISEIWAK